MRMHEEPPSSYHVALFMAQDSQVDSGVQVALALRFLVKQTSYCFIAFVLLQDSQVCRGTHVALTVRFLIMFNR
jgi:hypothetical protein